MGRPKTEIAASTRAAIAKRRAGLFKKAHELAVLCNAEVAVICFSSEGELHHFATSNAKKIVAKFKECLVDGYRPGLQSKPEEAVEQVAMEVDVPKLEGKKPQQMQLNNLLNVDFEKLKLLETFQLKEQIFKVMLSSKNSKEKLFLENIEESKKEKEKLQQDNESLLRQVQELEEASRAPPLYYPIPISMYYPQMAGEGGFRPWANFDAPPLAITSGHETEGNSQYADKALSLPSTSTAPNHHGHFINDSAPFMPSGAAPFATQNSNQRLMSALNPYLHWMPHGDTGADSNPMIVPSLQGKNK